MQSEARMNLGDPQCRRIFCVVRLHEIYFVYLLLFDLFYAWKLELQYFHKHLLMLLMEILPLSPETIFDDF